MKTLKEVALEAISRGYQVGNTWEKMLTTHLQENFPERMQELIASGELKDYVICQVSDSMALEERLESQGVRPDTAQQLAMERLLPIRPEDEDVSEYTDADRLANLT